MAVKKVIPNALTILRIILSVLLPFLSGNFFLPLYALAGVTDMLDGALARKWSVQSPAGARLDSLADLLFVISAFLRGKDILAAQRGIVIGLFLILLIRISALAAGWIRFRKAVIPHSAANRLTGLVIFTLYPVWLLTGSIIPALLMEGIALIAAIHELISLLKRNHPLS